MKKKYIALLAVAAMLGVFIGATPITHESGYGEVKQLTTTNYQVTFGGNKKWVYSVSINNTSDKVVYCLVNTTTADFDTAKGTSPATVISIPAGSSYTFADRGSTFSRRKIRNMWMDASADTGSANVYIAGWQK